MTQDRTKAIVEAAEQLGERSGLFDSDDAPWPRQYVNADGAFHEGVRKALVELRDALALPAPRWTKTPPKTSGKYWWRSNAKSKPALLPFEEGEGRGGEWWPVPIEEPPR